MTMKATKKSNKLSGPVQAFDEELDEMIAPLKQLAREFPNVSDFVFELRRRTKSIPKDGSRYFFRLYGTDTPFSVESTARVFIEAVRDEDMITEYTPVALPPITDTPNDEYGRPACHACDNSGYVWERGDKKTMQESCGVCRRAWDNEGKPEDYVEPEDDFADLIGVTEPEDDFDDLIGDDIDDIDDLI